MIDNEVLVGLLHCMRLLLYLIIGIGAVSVLNLLGIVLMFTCGLRFTDKTFIAFMDVVRRKMESKTP